MVISYKVEKSGSAQLSRPSDFLKLLTEVPEGLNIFFSLFTRLLRIFIFVALKFLFLVKSRI